MKLPPEQTGAGLERGVTLVEMMVALVLGLVITGGLIQVFSASRATYGFNEALSRLQENGRFALDTLSHRIRLAGHFGCRSRAPVTNLLQSSTRLAYDFSEGLQGFEGTTMGWAPSVSADLANRVVPGTDILVVRNAGTATRTLIPPFTDADSVFVNADDGDYEPGDILVVSDCDQATVFQATRIASTGTHVRLDHAAPGMPGNLHQGWPREHGYSTGAELSRAEVWVYYVGFTDSGGFPALFQQRLGTQANATSSMLVAQELVDSVETLQVLYGIDSAADGDVDRYLTADRVADWDSVVTVRIGLLVRAPERPGGVSEARTYDVNGTLVEAPDDGRQRQVFTTTIALRNRLP